MELSAIARQRLVNQRISGEKCADPAAAVRWLGALQAQDYGQALWAVGLRTQAGSRAEVEHAIARRAIVLTWPMRGTIHCVPAEDAQWMVRLLAQRPLAAAARRRSQLGLSEQTVGRARALVGEALAGGRCLTRAALLQVLAEAGISPQGGRGYHLLVSMAQEGLLCFGPQQAGQQTFVLLHEWVPQPRELSRAAALAELARRYFTSHGPATLPDFARWAGLSLTEARQGLAASQAELVAIKLQGVSYWGPAAVAPELPEKTGVQLLPGFDEYFLGYKDRSAIIAAGQLARICPGGNGVFKPMLVLDGQIVGTWGKQLTKQGLDLIVEFFAPVPELPPGLTEAARQFCQFMQLPPGTIRTSGQS
ncbi:MAG: winged helix DNA-binding domain-containing protein [Janthinobacterium lividum]